MLIARAFLALFAGFLAMAIPIAIFTALLMKLAPAWVGTPGHPRVAYVATNLIASSFAAALGGYVTAYIAVNNALLHTLVLALIVLLLAALSALQQRGMQPVWYQLLLIGITPAGILAGGLMRLHMMGI